jgi:hypothetical protein
MAAGMTVSAFLGPSALTVGVSVGLTALIALTAMVKAGRDGRLERKLRLEAEAPDARALEALQLGLDLLAAALSSESRGDPGPRPTLDALRRRLEALRE